MPYRANSLVRAVFAGPLAAAVVLGTNWTVSADECIERPNQQIDQAGHWYYYTDRAHHRRCWYFETSEATPSPPSSPDRGASPTAESPSWVSRFTASLAQTLPSEPQQNSAGDDSFASMRIVSSKHPKVNKVVRRERSRIVPATETTGAASVEQPHPLLPQSSTEKDGKHPPELTGADRAALFEDFLKWYMDKSIFGAP